MTHADFFKHFDLLADQPDVVSKVRGLILEFAIQGKIVSQNPKDESASKLVQRIFAHSAATDSDRAKRSRDNVEGLVPTEFWHPVPASWAVAPLGTVTNIIRGITFPTSAKGKIREKGTVACLRTANVQAEIEWDDLLFISEMYVGRDDQWLQPNDLVISMANSAALVGKLAQAREVTERATFGGFLAVIRPIELDSAYLLYFLRSPSVQAALRATSSQTTNIANISLGGMRPIPVAIPPLAEQRRIVAKVDELMKLCDELEQRQQKRYDARAQLQQSVLHHLLIAREPKSFAVAWQRVRDNFPLLHDSPDAIPQLRQAILELAVRGKLVAQQSKDGTGEELLQRIAADKAALIKAGQLRMRETPLMVDSAGFPFVIPTGWIWCHLGEICLNITDGYHNTPKTTSIGVPYITAQHIRPNIIDFGNCFYVSAEDHHELVSKTKPKMGDILVVNIGAGSATPAIIDVDFEFSFKNVAILNKHALIDSFYLYTFLYSTRPSIFQELTKGGAQPFLSLGALRNILVPLPPVAEQKRIVARVEALMRQCDELEAQLTQTQTLGARFLDATLHHILAA